MASAHFHPSGKAVRTGLFTAGILCFVGFGLFFTHSLIIYGHNERITELRALFGTAAVFLPRDSLRHPQPAVLQSVLDHIMGANPGAERMFLLGMEGGRVVYLADSGPAAVPGSAGREYEKASPGLKKAIAEAKPYYTYSHRGLLTNATVFVPVEDPTSGRLIAILGADLSPHDWMLFNWLLRLLGICLTVFPSLLLALLWRNVVRSERSRAFLKQSEEQYRALVDLSPNIVFRVGRNELISYMSSAITRLGYRPDELLGARWDVLVHPDDRARLRDALINQLNGSYDASEVEVRLLHSTEKTWRSYSIGCRIVYLDARGMWRLRGTEEVRANGQMMYAQGIARDVTEHLATQERLKLLTWAMEQSPAAILVTDRAGRIEYANPRFGDMSGFKVEEVIGRLPRILDAEAGDASMAAEVWKSILEGRAWNGEFLNVKKSGEQYWTAVSISAIRDDAGAITNFVAVEEDATGRRAAAIELRQAKEAAEAASKAKSTFLANMSHEIRTPLNAILGFSQLMTRDASMPQHLKESLHAINRSGEHLLTVINDVIEMSKIEAGRVTLSTAPLDLHALFEDLELMFSLRAHEKGLTFSVMRAPTVPRIIVSDGGKLRQIVINLVGNAVKFTEKGGVAVRVDASLDPPALTVSVEDTGVGISEEEATRLFGSYMQVSSGLKSGEGSGLGLAISREFARLLGGEIKLTSRPGVGSVFAFTIPMEIDLSARTPSQPLRRVAGLAAGQEMRRILVVDDNAYNRGVMSGLLGAVGFQVREAGSGNEAVLECGRWSPHAVLMDLRMPGMDGYQAIGAIRALPGGDGMTVIAVSSSTFDDSRRRSLEAGANDFLGKPFSEQELFDAVRRNLHVEYVYGPVQDGPPTAHQKKETAIICRRFLGTVSADVRERLRHAALIADPEQLHSLIEELDNPGWEVAAELHRLVNNFQYEELDALIGGAA